MPSLRHVVCAACLVASPLTRARAEETVPNARTQAVVESSVVKVFATMREADPYRPWTKGSPMEMTGSGVVIEGKRILTNAHVVLYASQVQIQANEAGEKISATIEAIAPGIDLAVLKLDNDSFFESHHPLGRETRLPDIKDAVMAYGFPTGGNSLSITKESSPAPSSRATPTPSPVCAARSTPR